MDILACFYFHRFCTSARGIKFVAQVLLIDVCRSQITPSVLNESMSSRL